MFQLLQTLGFDPLSTFINLTQDSRIAQRQEEEKSPERSHSGRQWHQKTIAGQDNSTGPQKKSLVIAQTCLISKDIMTSIAPFLTITEGENCVILCKAWYNNRHFYRRLIDLQAKPCVEAKMANLHLDMKNYCNAKEKNNSNDESKAILNFIINVHELLDLFLIRKDKRIIVIGDIKREPDFLLNDLCERFIIRKNYDLAVRCSAFYYIYESLSPKYNRYRLEVIKTEKIVKKIIKNIQSLEEKRKFILTMKEFYQCDPFSKESLIMISLFSKIDKTYQK